MRKIRWLWRGILFLCAVAAFVIFFGPQMPAHWDLCDVGGGPPNDSYIVCDGEIVTALRFSGRIERNRFADRPHMCHRQNRAGELESVVLEGRCKRHVPPETDQEMKIWIASKLWVTISCPFPERSLELTIALEQGSSTELRLGDCREVLRIPPTLCPPKSDPPGV